MKIGRNDPCPCGSGKKFKKCCIDKPEYRWRPPEPRPPKYRELLFDTEPGRLPANRASRWTPEKVRRMSNEAILARLQSLGVVLTEEEFLAQTDTVEASEELVYHWFTDTELGHMGLEEDFPFFAAWVLWERLRPDKPCLEQFSEWMEEGYDWWGKDDMRAFTPWWTLWEGVKAWAARKQIRSVQDLDKQVGRYSTQFYQNWLNDLDDLLQNLSVRDLKYAQRRLEWARDASQQFAESDDLTLLNWGRAQGESLFRLGDPEAGDAVYRQLTERFPDDIWAYVGWGDEYSPDFAAAPAYVDPERALRIYRLALEHVEPGSVDEETIRERMHLVEMAMASSDTDLRL